jgi:hypothetical protein
MTYEQVDFRQAYEALREYVRLERSQEQQERTCRILRGWRTVHMALVPPALQIMIYHGFMELKTIYFI